MLHPFPELFENVADVAEEVALPLGPSVYDCPLQYRILRLFAENRRKPLL